MYIMRLFFLLLLSSLMTACVIAPSDNGYIPESEPYGYEGNQSSTRADVFIQAGHEGRTRGKLGSSSPYGQEIKWTPIVANSATRHLRQAGISVIRADASWHRKTNTKLAFFIHFDGKSGNTCGTGASIGYDDSSDRPAAKAWKRLYSRYFPYRWQQDNFTKNLSHYYMFKTTNTRDAELVLELGAISCRQQALWLKPRLEALGQLIAYFAAERMGYYNRIAKPRL